MVAQGNSYLSRNIEINKNRYVPVGNDGASNTRLADRTLFSNSIDGKRYFSSLDSEIYFGETYIDELVQINWSVEQATMPLFGYNSYTYDDLAIGARQINGSFVINFTKSGFMYDVLKSVQAVNRSTLNTSETLNNDDDLTWKSNFDKEHKASWNRSFNIRVGYGDYNLNGVGSTMTVLYGVQITGCQQVIGIDGSPIAEAYTFLAKDIRYESSSSSTKNTQQSNTSNEIIQEKFSPVLSAIGIKKVNDSSYELSLKHNHDAGIIKDIKITLKKATGEKINTSMISIGKDNTILYTIPPSYSSKINREIDSQKSLGATSQHIVCDFTINYVQNGKEQLPYTLNDKKIYLA